MLGATRIGCCASALELIAGRRRLPIRGEFGALCPLHAVATYRELTPSRSIPRHPSYLLDIFSYIWRGLGRSHQISRCTPPRGVPFWDTVGWRVSLVRSEGFWLFARSDHRTPSYLHLFALVQSCIACGQIRSDCPSLYRFSAPVDAVAFAKRRGLP